MQRAVTTNYLALLLELMGACPMRIAGRQRLKSVLLSVRKARQANSARVVGEYQDCERTQASSVEFITLQY